MHIFATFVMIQNIFLLIRIKTNILSYVIIQICKIFQKFFVPISIAIDKNKPNLFFGRKIIRVVNFIIAKINLVLVLFVISIGCRNLNFYSVLYIYEKPKKSTAFYTMVSTNNSDNSEILVYKNDI